MSVERFFVSSVQWFFWATLNVLMLFLAVAAVVFLAWLVFEDDLAVSSLSVYECVFFILLLVVLKRSWTLHSSMGNSFGNYVYSMLFNLAVWGVCAFIAKLALEQQTNISLNSVFADVTSLASFLLAVYVSANLSPMVSIDADSAADSGVYSNQNLKETPDSAADSKKEVKVEGETADV
ncbi:MAG: hypothetical protein KKE30_14730 [Gammaproteobacteria bacterium]|nr:hypothetical protein [Gammaproteobacteria bacterium]MBU1557244.1 hypothetical protein [Gammaproteobacteria bacterium]MBU2071648.1 hypothetical protein [Gammaproteobacteria bacterium]MBU2182852.1 hypothetical protein [Gammaproteobacteria bacterium]MBU2204004.1 hypothetical protein [Gammaproteobacteria bacterium]